MDYQTCLQQFISILRAEDDEAEAKIAIYRSFPTPSAAEWAEVLKMVASDGGATGPFSCMIAYEVLLNRRGFQTPFGLFFDNLREIALNAGAPPKYVPDMLTLFLLKRATAEMH